MYNDSLNFKFEYNRSFEHSFVLRKDKFYLLYFAQLILFGITLQLI